MVEAFAALGVAARSEPAEEATDGLAEASAAYLLPGADEEPLRSACARHRVLSVAGEASLAEAGRVAVAVGLTDRGTPEMVVHLARLEDEGQYLPPRVLALARVIRED